MFLLLMELAVAVITVTLKIQSVVGLLGTGVSIVSNRRCFLRVIWRSRKTSSFKEDKLYVPSYQPAGGCKCSFIPQIPVIQIKDRAPTSKLNPNSLLWKPALACRLSPPGSESLFILCQEWFFPSCCPLTHGWNEVSCSAWTDTCPS